ncbi:P-loop containing nucleoside triphosphate hydrolase protein [Aspergillus sergii]|uniref:P-loop containing nucleoside triphosphate hydrolase protein n=1 Tax=Aspergillus sergii TaxID=1034303 RepID=A0A5N6WZ60_9EURO|nr:P-loop containing nucleoside triphosphate hydrolase protein [Aspergillus sergii]
MSKGLFSRGGSTVKFPVKSIIYHGLYEDTAMSKEIATDPPIYLILSSEFVKLRQGASTAQGRSRSFWNITFHLSQVSVDSLETKEDRLVYTFESELDLVGEGDTEGPGDFPNPSTYPLAAASFLHKVVVITLGFPSPKLWETQSELVCQALLGKLALSKEQEEYIALNRNAINEEAEAEHKCLTVLGCLVKSVAVGDRILLGIWPKEDRPFRIYRGCTLVLREGGPRRLDGSATENSSKWSALIDAPVHAVLLNDVDIKLVGEANEDMVKVHPVANPMVQIEMLTSTRKLSEQWGEENFDTMCRQFEDQEATIPSGSTTKLPLSSMFLSSTPRVPTHDPWDTSISDINAFVPKGWNLNEAQTQAATQLLTHSLSLVVGPPGTGKTRTIAAAAMIVTQIMQPGSVGKARLAVLVPTHAAAAAVMDQLSPAFESNHYGKEKLTRLRGRADSEARLFAGVTAPDDDITQMIACAKESSSTYRQFLDGIRTIQASGRLKSHLKDFNKQRQELIRAFMKGVQVVVTLPLNIREMIRREFNPEFVIFDEANFFRDPEIFHVLGHLRPDARVLFVGDDKQLSPPVFTTEGNTAWSVSAFERLINKKYHHTLLNVSYRSHKILYRPTSVTFYDGKVRTFSDGPCIDFGINAASPLVVRLGNMTWTLPGLSHFLHLARVEGDARKDPSGSWFHSQEAELGVTLARILVDRGVRDILIVTPYRAQVAEVKKIWEKRYPGIQVHPRVQTVDGSQGSEADAVIVLITRNRGSVSFLQSTKRANLMFSRACVSQYVVGNWEWVGSRRFMETAEKFFTYLNEADRVLNRTNYYTVYPKIE